MPECPLIKTPCPELFRATFARLHKDFTRYAALSTEPLPAPGLSVTREIRLQSEFHLPVRTVQAAAFRIYAAILTTRPVFSSTPFHNPQSWADCFASLPQWLQISPNPGIFFSTILNDRVLLERFVFYSFIPPRFNGSGFNRYPLQSCWLLQKLSCLREAGKSHLKVLDAASGTGEGTWEIASVIAQAGFNSENSEIYGWTVDPLEVWAAKTRCFYDAPDRHLGYENFVRPLIECSTTTVPAFACVDLLKHDAKDEIFDLIICNGLIGGPIINVRYQLEQLIYNFSAMLAPGGILLTANCFHGGWKKMFPEEFIAGLFEKQGLATERAGEGLAAEKKPVLV